MRFFTAAVAVLILVPASEAMAQRRRGLVDVSPRSERHGAWLSFGVGRGEDSYRYDVDPNFGHNLTKPAFFIAGGGTVNSHLRLGGEINAWVNQYTDNTGYGITETLVGGLFTAQVYPVKQLGLFVKGGLGISRSAAYVAGSGYSGTGETGFGYLYGVGYEQKLGRNFFITPLVSVMNHMSNPGRRNDPDPLGALHERVVMIGVGLTFQPGR